MDPHTLVGTKWRRAPNLAIHLIVRVHRDNPNLVVDGDITNNKRVLHIDYLRENLIQVS